MHAFTTQAAGCLPQNDDAVQLQDAARHSRLPPCARADVVPGRRRAALEFV